jgi:uncharacterized damage-inducible protein DinB
MLDTAVSTKARFLESYDHEHEITMRVLHAYPADQLDLRPHPRCKTARELAWIFVLERGLATGVWNNALASGMPRAKMPDPPNSWDAIVAEVEQSHQKFGELVRAASEDDFQQMVKFFTAPKTMGDIRRIDFLWFLLHDEIHHRGQFSVYLRMAGGKVPSIYGPSGDEPWT